MQKSNEDINTLYHLFCKNIPKLSYENKIHKKVYQSNLYLAIPRGNKGFLWFIEWKNMSYCFFIDPITQFIQQKNVSFCSDIARKEGTILYGTFITIKNKEYYTIEDIFYYYSRNIGNETWEYKFRTIKTLLETNIYTTFYGFAFLKLCLPFLENSLQEFIHKLTECPYPIQWIQYRLWNKSNFYLYTNYIDFLQIYNINTTLNTNTNINSNTNNNTKLNKYNKVRHNTKPDQYKEFYIKASVINDIYYLYEREKENMVDKIEYAYIPDYTTSLLLNKLFRNIKENIRLDSLEESDDEEEFQNTNEDKFVDMNKSHKMLCKYHSKFKKWVPIKVL